MTISCAFCSGTGVQPHSLKMSCLSCRGKGKIEFDHAAMMCPACKGNGRASGFSELSCIRCRGAGMIKVDTVRRGKKTVDIIKGMFRRIVRELSGAGKRIKSRLIKKILWFKTIFRKIKRHS